MNKRLSSILTTCLIFGSLYLPVHAEEVRNATPPVVKKSAQAHYSEGVLCLNQTDLACAKLALANIPSVSPYAKLLQAHIALSEQQTDEALRLLLPLQADSTLMTEAKVNLHQLLAQAFKTLDDIPQALQHLIQADALNYNPTNQAHLWGLLNQLDLNQLIAMRGENTDNNFQGWIDLCLAAKNQNAAASIADWMRSYADHPAFSLAKQLSINNTPTTTPASLKAEGAIALILPTVNAENTAKAEAFKLGLTTALEKNSLHNAIKTYAPPAATDDSAMPNSHAPQALSALYALAKNEGSAYFVTPQFETSALIENHDDLLKLQFSLKDEATRIAQFATHHAMQYIAIITRDDEASKERLQQFKTAWLAATQLAENDAHLTIITLPKKALETSHLLEIKPQIASKPHDLILLSLAASDAATIRPYLDISIPTIGFANLGTSIAGTLNAIRFTEIPFLIPQENDAFADYRAASLQLDSNELLRWYALGVDTLKLLMAQQQDKPDETIINGLTGKLRIDKTGNISRELAIARLTYNGIQAE
ncbi:MAG: hypothetical protein HOP21_07365 [Methylotenera sp.]|nr:hypothetical protein [Methylotenera sp.]